MTDDPRQHLKNQAIPDSSRRLGRQSPKRRTPSPVASMFGAAQIIQGAITAQKIRLRAPDILVRPKVEHSAVFDFFLAS
jgi:NTE family protein